jgi:hypothetical protein
MTARPWTPDHRDALLTRVRAITTGTAVAGCVGALGLAIGFATTAHATTPATKAAGPSTSSGTTTPGGSADSGSRTRPGSSSASAAVAPSQVQVQVLNGVGIAGAARLVAEQLRSAGFDVIGIGNASRMVATSGIVYSPDQVAAFRTLSDATGVTLSSAQGTGTTLTLVVGQDWQGALPAAQAAPQAVPQGRSNGGGTGPQTTTGGS